MGIKDYLTKDNITAGCLTLAFLGTVLLLPSRKTNDYSNLGNEAISREYDLSNSDMEMIILAQETFKITR
ncbi:MAG: hypothetical protein ABIA78_02825 [archaeon]